MRKILRKNRSNQLFLNQKTKVQKHLPEKSLKNQMRNQKVKRNRYSSQLLYLMIHRLQHSVTLTMRSSEARDRVSHTEALQKLKTDQALQYAILKTISDMSEKKAVSSTDLKNLNMSRRKSIFPTRTKRSRTLPLSIQARKSPSFPKPQIR